MSTKSFLSGFKALAGAIAVLSNGQQNQRDARGGNDLASVEAHSFNANLVKGVLNPKVFDLSVAGQQVLQERSQLSNIPLAIAQLKN